MRASRREPGTPPIRHSPARAQRQRLAVDVALAAILAAVFLAVAQGLGVVAFIGVPILLVALVSVALERVVARRRSRGTVHLSEVPSS